ncbi:MAG: hypothetical protein ACREBU_01640 [Nitrososphaera sp.]
MLAAASRIELVEPRIQLSKNGGVSIIHAKKSVAIAQEKDMPVLQVTNEYGNSVSYDVSDSHRFDRLLANLWQFVKDSQH